MSAIAEWTTERVRRCHGCRHSVSADVAKCPTVRLLDQLEAVARGEAV